MPFKLTWAERQIFLNHTWGPGPIIDMFAPLAFKAVLVGNKLNLFDTLQNCGPLSAADLSQKTGTDGFGLRLLLQTLCSLGYLRLKRGGRYANSPMTKAWMLTTSSANLSAMLGYFNDTFDRWSNLEQSLLDGKPAERGDGWLNRHPGSWERYHASLRSVAELMGGQIASRAGLSQGAKRLIDIGGSHGLYSVKFCERYPHLSAVIFDLDHARAAALQTVASTAMESRISFVSGSVIADELGEGFDIALLINFIRVFPEKEVGLIFRKTFDALGRGGRILIADQFHHSARTSFSQANALLIFLELFTTGAGKIYTVSEVKTLLASVGFSGIAETKLRRSPGISIVSATRP